ncbi:protein farnesyltransferase/geranylgeranyltransferase type-1 subunit alpha [Ceratobasidium sp. AG-Ba]|nr:protein farnesyltransferase/geranylgeranyltransferase type-1 subunit alpha [Ceratobasidium sp. AG-Ba]QRW04339.1 protein farnesyltransferase/geranylgeranyltransferase type-1 subunit alpha [Ceratobasidium sp. AG-Ba]
MHGIKRVKQTEEALKAQKERERAKVERYIAVEKDLFERRSSNDLSQESLEVTTAIIGLNPELYTAWNFRRIILTNGIFPQSSPSEIFSTIDGELLLTFAALQVHPKVYWLWNHRRWCLQNIPEGPLGSETSKSWRSMTWARELAIVEKMLDRDARNFHAWNYRRYVLASMPESDRRPAKSELAYTTRKIEQNFSNFSAWHQRTKVWGVIWAEQPESEAGAKQEGSDSPTLKSEINAIEELVAEVGTDSKWPLQALVHYKTLLSSHDPAVKFGLLQECKTLTERLIQVDPKRRHMYEDQLLLFEA